MFRRKIDPVYKMIEFFKASVKQHENIYEITEGLLNAVIEMDNRITRLEEKQNDQ